MHDAPLRLRCEYLDDPLGIDIARPRLSWWLNDPRPAEIQTAYHVVVASRLDLLLLDEGDLWDSGRIESQRTCQVEYAGKALVSHRQAYWKVRTYDSDGLPSAWSEPARFEIGLLAADDWIGRWIGAPLVGTRASSVPVPLLRRSFDLASEPVSARLHVAALGLFRVRINGLQVGGDEPTSGWVDYERRVEYVTYDVTNLLHEGTNGIGMLLADGWYAGHPGCGDRQQYGDQAVVIAQLRIEFNSGSSFVVGTDPLWQWRPSWILSSDLVVGESTDNSAFESDWADSDERHSWYPVTVFDRNSHPEMERVGVSVNPVRAMDAYAGERIESESEPESETEVVQKLRSASDAAFEVQSVRHLYRFPHPMMGRARLNARVPDAGVVRIRYALSPDEFEQPCGEDVFGARGDEEGETFESTFSLHGFQYVEISGDVFNTDHIQVVGVGIRRELAVTGNFLCDHPLFNELHTQLVMWRQQTAQTVAMAGLSAAERVGNTQMAGWGIAHGMLALDSAAFYGKWLRDLSDAQLADGGLPLVVPMPPSVELLSSNGGAGCTDVYVSGVWQAYRYFGDRRALQIHFPNIKAFLFGLAKRFPDFIRRGETLRRISRLPEDFYATAWYYQSARLGARIAGVLGNLTDMEDFEELAADVRSAFRSRFVTPEGRLISDSIEAYSLALGFGLLESAQQHTAVTMLLELTEAMLTADVVVQSSGREMPIPPGLLQALTQMGRIDLAYRLILSRRIPERPDEVRKLIQAGVGEWLFAAIAGLELERDLSDRHNAFRRVKIQPRLPLGIGLSGFAEGPPIRQVEAVLDTINGRYQVSWEITDDEFRLQVLVPCNCTARVLLPDDTEHEVVSGRHELVMPFNEAGDGIPVLREVS